MDFIERGNERMIIQMDLERRSDLQFQVPRLTRSGENF